MHSHESARTSNLSVEEELCLAELPFAADDVLYAELDDEVHSVPFGLSDEPFMPPARLEAIRRSQQAERDKTRSYTPSHLRRQFDLLLAAHPEIDFALLCQQANSPSGVPAHVISQSDLDRTEDRTLKMVRAKPRQFGSVVFSDTSSVELSSLTDVWRYLDGTERRIVQKIFDGRILYILTA